MKLGILSSNFKTNLLHELENSKLASNRMRLNVARKAAENNHIEILPLDFYNQMDDVDCLLIGKYVHASGANKFIDDDGTRIKKWLRYIEYSKVKGTKIVLDYTDHLIIVEDLRSQFYQKVINFVDIIIVPSNMMKKNLSNFYKGEIEIIEEPVEVEIEKIEIKNFDNINALWFGHPTNLNYLLKILIKLNKISNLNVVTSNLSQKEKNLIQDINKNIKIKFFEWEKDFYKNYKIDCNVCLIPSDLMDAKKNGVSNNRLITSFALGLVPILTPVESYKEFSNYYCDISNIQNIDKFTLEKIYNKIIDDRKEILNKYSIDCIGKKWCDVLFSNKKI